MRRLVLHAPRDIRLEARPDPEAPTGSDIVLRTELGLISSGTERRLYLGLPIPAIVNVGFQDALHSDRVTVPGVARYEVAQENRPVPPTYPTSLGYNAVGTVDRVGPDVSGLRPGDRVMSTGPHSECLVLPEWQVVQVPDAVPTAEAVFAYLATLGLSALRRIGFQAGQNVVVMGLGIVGVTAALVAAACGARVVAVDTDPFRRDLARGTGVLAGVLDPTADDFGEVLRSLISPEGVDHVIETAGNPAALRDAIRIVRQRGHVAVLALYAGGVPGDVLADLFHAKECSLVSCANDPMVPPEATSGRFTVAGNIRFVLELLASRRLSFTGLLTHEFPVADAATAYETMATNDSSFLGLGLRWDSRAMP